MPSTNGGNSADISARACAPVVPTEPRDALEAADTRLYHLQHLCAFIGDVAAASKPREQISESLAESVQVVFGFLADEIEAARDQAMSVYQALPPRRQS